MANSETTAKAIIVNHEGKILVLRSSKWEERPDRSQKPDLPGGMVESGELPSDGVAREVSEEAGISVPASEYVLLYSETEYHEDTDTSILKFIYTMQIDASEVTLSWEHEAYEWITPEEFLRVEWRPFYERAHRYIFAHNLLSLG